MTFLKSKLNFTGRSCSSNSVQYLEWWSQTSQSGEGDGLHLEWPFFVSVWLCFRAGPRCVSECVSGCPLLPYQRAPGPTQYIPLCSLVEREPTHLLPGHFWDRLLIETARHFLGMLWDLATAQLKCTQKRFDPLTNPPCCLHSHLLRGSFGLVCLSKILGR